MLSERASHWLVFRHHIAGTMFFMTHCKQSTLCPFLQHLLAHTIHYKSLLHSVLQLHPHKFSPIIIKDRHGIIASILSYPFDLRIIMM